MTSANFDWGLQNYMDGLANKYSDQEFFRSNLFFKPYNHAKRIYIFNTEDFFMLQGYTMVKYWVRPHFTTFQQSILRLLKLAPSQLGLNACLMLATFEYMCNCLDDLKLSPFSFFYFFNYSTRSKIVKGYIYFSQREGIHHVFKNLLSSHKAWKDMFVKISHRTNKELACWMTQLRKLVFPLKWAKMEKKNYEYPLWGLSSKNHTMVDIITKLCENGPHDILDIMG